MAASIVVDNVSKRYRLGAGGTVFTYRTLRDTIASAASRLGGNRRPSTTEQHIWALRDLSMQVEQGEVVGVIGRNGSGKSTLLKILSRITRPTSGEAVLGGRVGSLLEVGTGFHAELTGRDNIFLNGAILGMRREEIRRKFDDIVDFSGVATFIDTPVKRYSSGMYVRLAFAVAAHLEPEILLVDEVLAVGDAAFQRQCLGKMQDISRSGRTILFVSHNMPAITRLCSRAVLIGEGRVLEDGPADRVVARYLSSELGTEAQRHWPDLAEAPGNDGVRLRSVRVIDETGAPIESVDVRRTVGIEVTFTVIAAKYQFVPGIALVNDQGQPVFSAIDTDPLWRDAQPEGDYTTTAWIPPNLLNEGAVVVSIALGTFTAGGRTTRQAHAPDVVSFHVVDHGEGGTARGDYPATWSAPVRPLLSWTTTRAAVAAGRSR
jgi:lipopolysaccharide transport system ATP-binding protein